MGQKVNPIGFRLGVNRDWRSKWYASPQEMPAFLHSDLQIRNYVKKKPQTKGAKDTKESKKAEPEKTENAEAKE